jgi:hypothetical protein
MIAVLSIPFLVDNGEAGWPQPLAEAVELLEVHDQWAPSVGIDSVRAIDRANFGGHMHPVNVNLEKVCRTFRRVVFRKC